VEQGRVADGADSGYALLLAAEIAERAGDLAGALGLVQRAVAAYHASGDTEYGFPRAYQAELLLRMGRDEEARTQLAALRPLLGRDPGGCYVSQALDAAGRADLAVQWLPAALEPALQARALAGRTARSRLRPGGCRGVHAGAAAAPAAPGSGLAARQLRRPRRPSAGGGGREPRRGRGLRGGLRRRGGRLRGSGDAVLARRGVRPVAGALAGAGQGLRAELGC